MTFAAAALLPSLHLRRAYALLTDRAWLRITGGDAARWLNGMVTNAIQALAPGHGTYNFLLNAQGRIQGDCLIYRETGSADATFLLETDTRQMGILQPLLDRYIIMDDVELAPAFEDQTTLLLLGSELPALVQQLALPPLEPMRLTVTEAHGEELVVSTPPPAATPQFCLRASRGTVQALTEQLRSLGAEEIDAARLEQLRVLEARPLFGKDIRDRDLPQETNQPHALHFAKGCYLGQEIVERIRSRGQVHRVLTPFRLEGAVPETLPAQLEVEGKPAGELTSVVAVETGEGESMVGLGFARREFLERQASLHYAGGTAVPRSPAQLV